MKAKDLRNSILQLAVQGKLVPQDPSDEPASVLLERIRAERAKLIKEKKIKAPKGGESIIYRASDGSHYEKRGKGEPVCVDDEIPFEIPESWAWARLESLAAVLNGDRGKNYPAKSKLTTKGIPFVSAVNISDGIVVEDQMLYMTEAQFKALRAGKLQCNDIVFCIRGSLGKLGIFPFERGAIASSLAIVRPYFSLEIFRQYLFCMLDAPITSTSIRNNDNGTAQPNLAAKSFERFLYPIPPIQEQERIIDRVAELMPIIEAYGALEDARERLDVELPGRLRKSILQLAVQGKLVEQESSDEPASVLLERIRAERAKLVKEKKIKAPKGGESVIYRASDGGYYEKRGKGKPQPIEVPFDVPDSWEWVRLKSLGEIVGGGTPKTHDSSLWSTEEDGIPWITPADMKNVQHRRVSHGDRYLSDKGLSGSSAQLMPAGTVVMSSRAPIGYLAIADCQIATNQGFKSIVPTIVKTNEWILLALDALMDDIKRRASGTTFKEISGSEFGETLVPLPPFPEQERIIALFERAMTANS